MRLKEGKRLDENLKLLKNCSSVRIAELIEERDRYIRHQLTYYMDYLNSKESKPFTSFLVDLAEKQGKTIESSKDLLSVIAKSRDEIPENFREQYHNHANLCRPVRTRNKEIEEFESLNKICKTGNVQKINDFLSYSDHTKSFQQFGKFIRHQPAIFISNSFTKRAENLAERNYLFKDKPANYLSNNLSKSFDIKKIALSLNKDFNNRIFRGTIKGTLIAALSAVAINIAIPDDPANPIGGNTPTPTPTPSYGTHETTPSPAPVQTPISNSIDINSYETACQDFYQKTAEVYKYNTGKDIDLSQYGQENISTSDTTIYIVNYNGKTLRFSKQSSYADNQKYLENALSAAGATFEKQDTSATCILDENGSIAIVDKDGNPVKSGNVLQSANASEYAMYNQLYVTNAKKMLEAQGINTSNMTESELVGRYILSDNYNIQNDELSKALGKTASLASYIKNYFYLNNGKPDPYAISTYKSDSEKFAKDFNNEATIIADMQTTTSPKDLSER